MKVHPLVAHFQDKNLRPFSARWDARMVHIPSLREVLDRSEALRAKSIFSERVFAIAEGSINWVNPNPEITVLDLRSSDTLSKEKISNFRQQLLDKNKLKWRLRARCMVLGMQKKFRWLDMEEYTFGQRTEEAKSLCMLLNEIYQLAVLGMNKDGYTVPPDQMNRVFSTFDDFDQFVANLTAEPTFEWKGKYRTRYERVIRCVAIRYMINIFDTLNSEKYRKVVEDREILMGRLKESPLKIIETKSPWSFQVELPGPKGFRGTLIFDEKTFDSINMKKRSNRSYGDTESMADLLRMRFEGPRGDQENMTRAVNFFTEHFFSKQLLKVRGDFIPLHDIQDRAKLKKIKATGKASTVTTLSNAAIIWFVRSWKDVTDQVECQFQYEWEMANGVNSTEIYDLKKYLTWVCRDMGSVDLGNILFYVRQLPLDKIKMTEQEVLDDLFLPQGTSHTTSSRPLSKKEIKSKQEKLSLIEQLWRGPVGFMLPVRTRKWIRFISQMAFSPELFTLYPDLYAPAPFTKESPSVLRQMKEEVDVIVNIRLDDFQERYERYEPIRKSILAKYEGVSFY